MREEELISRLIEQEKDVRYQVPATICQKEFYYIRGRNPILISAPHGASHKRPNEKGGIDYKEEDEYTVGFTCLIADLTGAHAIYLRRRTEMDSNWYPDTPYKKRLRQIVVRSKIKFVLDIHGAKPDAQFGIALGTMKGKSCINEQEQIIQIFDKFGFRRNEAGLSGLAVNAEKYTGCGKISQETITCFCNNLGIPAAQLELNAKLRIPVRREDAKQEDKSFRGDPVYIAKAINVTAALVKELS